MSAIRRAIERVDGWLGDALILALYALVTLADRIAEILGRAESEE